MNIYLIINKDATMMSNYKCLHNDSVRDIGNILISITNLDINNYHINMGIDIPVNGGLWAWGKNNFGQLGLGDTLDRSSTNWKIISGRAGSTIGID